MPSSVEASDTPVTFEEVRRRLDDPDLILVNALPEVAFEERRIPRSLSLPVADIPTRSRQVLPDPAKEIIVYCGGPT